MSETEGDESLVPRTNVVLEDVGSSDAIEQTSSQQSSFPEAATFKSLKKMVNELDEENPDPSKLFDIKMMANTLLNRAKRLRRAKGLQGRIEKDRTMLESTELAIKKHKENVNILEQLERYSKQKTIQQKPEVKEIEGEDGEPIEEATVVGNSCDEPSLAKKQKPSDSSSIIEEEAVKVRKDGALFHLSRAKRCYVCKQQYNKVHKFYHSMCLDCGDYNFAKRECTKPDLLGKIAIITGGRIKIGYLSSLLLLRSRCEVHVTSRFPKDALNRYKQEPDYEVFRPRLFVYGLDFRDVGAVKSFCDFFKQSVKKLDILINNAAQCVKREPSYFKYLLDVEATPLKEFSESDLAVFSKDFELKEFQLQLHPPQSTSSTPTDIAKTYAQVHFADSAAMNLSALIADNKLSNERLYPTGVVDSNNIQVDLASANSWTAQLQQVPIFEFMETQVINAWAPFIMCQLLAQCMMTTPEQKAANKYIVNVSSVEGKFQMNQKPTSHPHNNMSKASLNMLTRTVGPQYAKDFNIFMTCVDTGWVSNDMIPRSYLFNNVYKTTPLDELDGALRVVDPVFQGIATNRPEHTVFYQNYRPTDW